MAAAEEDSDLPELDADLLELRPDPPLRRVLAWLRYWWGRVVRRWLRPEAAPARARAWLRSQALPGLRAGWSRARPWLRQRWSQVQRWPAAGRDWWLKTAPLRQRAAGWTRSLDGWPRARGRRLYTMALGAFVLGCGLGLAVTVGAHGEPSPVALERVAIAPAAPEALWREPQPADLELPPAPPETPKPSRSEVARQLAFESFAQGATLDGVSYYRIALRARRRAPGDDVLTRQTIAALADPGAAASAQRLLRQLGRDARPLLVQAARRHPNRAVRTRARALIGAPASRPFLRWVR